MKNNLIYNIQNLLISKLIFSQRTKVFIHFIKQLEIFINYANSFFIKLIISFH